MDESHLLQALGNWYSGNPHIRRACAFRGDAPDVAGEVVLHVFLDVEPVMDSDEILPVWLAHSRTWESQLREVTGCLVRLDYLQADAIAPGEQTKPLLLDMWAREAWDG